MVGLAALSMAAPGSAEVGSNQRLEVVGRTAKLCPRIPFDFFDPPHLRRARRTASSPRQHPR
ncbi:MAG: hypothetical protein WAU20_01605, partial [Dokdonella sp.]